MNSTKRRLVYLMGIPGAGKSTLMEAVFKGVPGVSVTTRPSHVIYPGGAMLGLWREKFSGTDTLALNIQPDVIQWLKDCPFTAVVGEGDRLCNNRFFDSVIESGWTLSIVLLNTPAMVAAERRRQRGSNQNLTWIKGRISKVQALSRRAAFGWHLDGTQPIELLAAKFRTHPIIRQILLGEEKYELG